MHVLMTLAILAATAAVPAPAPRGAIEATFRGTAQPLEVELLLRDAAEEWKEVGHQTLPATRRVRFEGLEPGVYQILAKGKQPTERLATKIVVGTGDTRRTTIAIEPFALTGRVTLGGTDLGAGLLTLRHREFYWRAGIALAADGTFRAPLWQRGPFSSSVRGPALPTAYVEFVEIEGASPVRLAIDIPDGRIRGTVRDAASGAPVAGATVALQTRTETGEQNVQLTSDPAGRFDFIGIRHGKQTVRIFSPRYLEPEPIDFPLGDAARLKELDVRLDSGREVAIVVIDRQNDPVAGAKVVAVSGSRIRARTTTDEDGRSDVPLPKGEPATLFVVAPEEPFGMLRIGREDVKERLRVYLPRAASSLMIRAQTTDGRTMPPFSLLMRYNGELVPMELANELQAVQGLQLAVGAGNEAHLRNIPSGSYEFWPYRGDQEAQWIVDAGAMFPPIQVNVRTGENKIAVKFAAK